jgi:hypothetical protein
MGTVFAFLGTFLLSLFVALLAALQLVDYFLATEEFIAVLMAIVIFAIAAIVVFAVTYVAARSTRTFNIVVVILALLVLALVAAPGGLQWLADRSSNPFNMSAKDVQITLELLVPAIILVLVQWGLVRHRWLRARGLESLTLWPWVTTAVVGLAVLNPVGLAIVSAGPRDGHTDWLRGFSPAATLVGLLLVVVAVVIECYIRMRMLRRRLGSAA